MSANIVAALSRQAAQSLTRRGSLLMLGGTLAAAVTGPSLTEAADNRKQNKKDKKKKQRKATQPIAVDPAEQAWQAENQANQVCANQVAACRTEILSICSLPGGQCFAAAECCSSLATCNTSALFTCIVNISSTSN